MKSAESILKRGFANLCASLFFKFFALNFNLRPDLKKYLKSTDGWINFIFIVKTESLSINRGLSFKNGHVKTLKNFCEKPDAQLIFRDEKSLGKAVISPPNELMILLMKNEMKTEGNIGYLQLFNFYLSLILKRVQISKLKKESKKRGFSEKTINKINSKKINQLKSDALSDDLDEDIGVKHLKDRYLADYSLKDFPRIEDLLSIHHTKIPEICHERPELLTDWFRENGFEKSNSGEKWIPELRQANAYKYLMENRKPIIRKNDLIAGTTTTKEVGVVIYPDAHGTMIWGELLTAPHRPLNPYNIDKETINVLHKKVFPYWVNKNFREWVRENKDYPICQKIDESFAAYFLWKSVSLSHTIIDYPKILSKGTIGIISEIEQEIKNTPEDNRSKIDTLNAMKICLEGINLYSDNLSKEAKKLSENEIDSIRKKELEDLSAVCGWVPKYPCTTLHEAVNAMWIIWVGVHMENTNAGFSLGRLDQWLQPYFESDIRKLKSDIEKEKYLKSAIELISCFYLKCTDHLPLVPDIGNYLFGGSSSDQAITLGGITPEGLDGVNDMTYIFLKVTEILSLRDPNVNARFHKGKNSNTYLKRLCEVNLNTGATPSIHNDEEVMASLKEFNFKKEDLRDWSATGCVEPTISGKHMGHTNCMMFNMVAAFEMAMNNGYHPLMRWDIGPKTGEVDTFNDFQSFFKAFEKQFEFLADQSCKYNNYLGIAHQNIRPTPFISSFIEGPLEKGLDLTKGGATYNSSGTACIGLADITDSLMVIKKLVYDEKKISLERLFTAVKTNFKNDKALYAMVKNKVKIFGSGDEESLSMANKVTRLAHEIFKKHKNYRGGIYNAGFWSMSNHVAFGTLTGALPSGRFKGKAFTPGLTPQSHASSNLLDNIRDVASLDTLAMGNNIAFNLKVVPGRDDNHAKSVENIFSYVKGYTDLGGMQIQLNVVSSETLKDAMENPQNYQNLLVRISGYNAYFTTLNKDMQLELIERAEYGL